MTKIDIHTKKKLNDNEVRYSGSISPIEVKNYVFNNIDFKISETQWDLIDNYFADYWNNKIGIGGVIYLDEFATYIYNNIVKDNQLISKEHIEQIANLMLTKIKQDGGFLE